jgi:hypothetical protein
MSSNAETLREVVNLDMPREILWSLKCGRELGPLAEREGRWEVIRTLGAIALLDRNWRLYDGLSLKTTHIEDGWERLQSSALKEIGRLGGDEGASMLYLITHATRLSMRLPGEGPAEDVLGQRVTNIEKELISPAYNKLLGSGLSLRWLPWNPRWRGWEIENWEDFEGMDHYQLVRDGKRFGLKVIDDRQSNIKVKSCRVLKGVEGPLATECLLRLGSWKYERKTLRDIAIQGLVRMGLSEKEAKLLCRSIERFDTSERRRLCNLVANEGLGDGAGRLITEYGEELSRLYGGRLAEEIMEIEKSQEGGIKARLKGILRNRS